MPVFVTDAARTPVGAAGGALCGLRAGELTAVPLRSVLERSGMAPARVDALWLGTADAAEAHAAAASAGIEPRAVVTVADGLLAILRAAEAIEQGEADVAVAGGAETMSHSAPAADGHAEPDHPYLRETQARWLAAHERGAFAEEVVPVGEVGYDDHPRPDGAGDGAAVAVLTAARGPVELRATAKVVGEDALSSAVDRALNGAGVALDEVTLAELHEASPEEAEAAVAAIGIDRSRVNTRGGTLAIGHPVGMTGARLVVSAFHGLREHGGGVALVAVGAPNRAAYAAVLTHHPIDSETT